MTEAQRRLLAEAQRAARRAYCPYSNYRVGAAVLADGRNYHGANIENASSNLGICAERVALAVARMAGVSRIQGIAVHCSGPTARPAGSDERSCLPCGGCLQWIAEHCPEAWIVTNGSEKVYRLTDLLPRPFSLPNGAPARS